ncbi:zinc finger BED domain-containing protein RICESLEEPER 2-like [Dioscorea cayenensis subsp. rotundata]|uniref:Zinc finger BED domain-containing protein RICESLEEPER 2-like n=1 Tax=Dioscorea cayennensis subsp. rotundata TaxID=55577 RepID=A0AB40CVB1_DIOCR|nr:zinc finger BED domain-containing protein RICESLEEPER 2-like [Dioscorea cayenensis subsp. rotundata]
MVLTAHFIDHNWRLQKRVINFVRLPPPRRGVEIADGIFKCLKEWGIENKVFTISVDNASSNDVAIRILKDTFSRTKRLLCGGKLFHVRCCAHILNLMVQDGISEIEEIIEDIHESVKFINQSEARLKSFSDIVQQLQLSERKLILDCKTRWNSTFEMLSVAMKFKDIFPMFKDREILYHCCPCPEDWEKVDKICEILEVFNAITKIISGSDYPTSNLFLNEVYRVKMLLDKRVNDENDFIRAMIGKMKAKFDKYWGECNLLMSVAAVLDPRCKMRVVDFTFARMYSDREARENIAKVREALHEIYEKYVREYQYGNEHSGETPMHNNDDVGTSGKGSSGNPDQFNALEWWKGSTFKNIAILSRMARDILAIPITTVGFQRLLSVGGGGGKIVARRYVSMKASGSLESGYGVDDAFMLAQVGGVDEEVRFVGEDYPDIGVSDL